MIVTPRSRTLATIPLIIHSATCAGSAGTRARAMKYRTALASELPSSSRWSASVQVPPSRPITSVSTSNQSGSESMSSPSMSKRMACGPRGPLPLGRAVKRAAGTAVS